MAEQRKDSRSAASLKVKYKSATVDEFVLQFGTDVSRGGIFIKTKSPLEAGALLKLELQLSTAAAVISGVGRVAWRRVASQDPAKPAGMGIKFVKLEPTSQVIVDRIVAERGAESSRFDQSEGAELARPSLEPPASSLRPDRASSPGAVDAPATVRPPAPVAMPAAAVASKPLIAPKAAAPAPKPAPAPAPKPAPVAAAPAAAPAAASSAAGVFGGPSQTRLAPAKAAIPSGLFATSSLAAQPAAPMEEKRTSFFPPAPSPHAAPARGGSNASGQLNASRSSAGSVSSPLNRPGNSRAPGPLNPRASTATGPKGVFGAPSPASPLANSTSGLLRPAKEISGPSSSSMLPGRSADDVPTAAVPRPPGGRADARVVQPAPEPSLLDGLSDDLFGEAEGSGAANIDGMFATLEPIDALGEAPPVRGSRPSSPQSSPLGDRISPAPANGSGAARRDLSGTAQGLAAAEAADVDNLFADLEDNDATTDQIPRPAPASAVFPPGSARPSHPSLPALADDLASDDAFGEADLLGGDDDKGAPPFDDDDEYAEDDAPAAAAAASEPPMLRLAEPARSSTPEPAKRSPALMFGVGALLLLLIAGGAIALFKPDLLVQLGIVSGAEPPPAKPVAPPPPIEIPGQPMIEPPTTAQPADPAAAAAPAAAAPVAAPDTAPSGESVQVNVTSLPRGADVRVAGVLKGQTPTNVDLTIGRETNVTVSAPGYAAQAKLVTAIKEMDPLRYKLEPLPYVLVVITTPPEAELTVGSVTSVSPAPLALGHISSGVDVAVTKKGYRRTTRNVRLDEFTERDGVLRAEIQVSLSPMPGTDVDATPAAPEAEVAPEPSSSSSSSRRRRSRGSRTAESAPAPPEPEGEASADPAPEAEAKPESAAEPEKAPGAPPPPPALPSLP